MCITFTLFTPLHIVKFRLKTPHIYVNEYFYCFVKNFFCKLRKIFFKKLLTFFTHSRGVIKSASLSFQNCQILILLLNYAIAKILFILTPPFSFTITADK
jgi:hypothetical protein